MTTCYMAAGLPPAAEEGLLSRAEDFSLIRTFQKTKVVKRSFMEYITKKEINSVYRSLAS